MPRSSNRLLESLSTDDFDLLEPHLESVTLGLRKSLERPNRRIETVYFSEGGFASVVAVQPNGKQVEVGLIGREGMTGLPIVFGNHRSPHATYIQAPGTGKCMPATELRKATQARLSLRDSLLKFVQGIWRSNNTHRRQQRAVQVGCALGALALDGARSDRRGYAVAHARVFVAHAGRPPARRDRSSACPPKTRPDFLCPWADHREEPQGTGAQGRHGLWHSRAEYRRLIG
jgi:CRP-like cAMP-binding protein